jgi:hypothetical protein
MFPVGPLDDAEPPDAAPSRRPCQEIPADLGGIPSKFVGRTSLVAKTWRRPTPPFFRYSGVAPPSADHLLRRPRRKPTSGHRKQLIRTSKLLVKLANHCGFDSRPRNPWAHQNALALEIPPREGPASSPLCQRTWVPRYN